MSMLDALLIFYCGKNSKKKKKIKQVLNTLSYDEATKEYKCKSTRDPEKEYIIFYHTVKGEWFCNCKAPLYKKYKTFETLKDRKRKFERYGCVHIIATKIFKALNHHK